MRTWSVALVLMLFIAGCETGPQPGLTGIYNTWDDVINRWIGKKKEDLYYEIGPPNMHPHTSADGYEEMKWDMTIPSLPGMAEQYGTLPLYGQNVNCQLVFVADPNGIIVSGHRIGCD